MSSVRGRSAEARDAHDRFRIESDAGRTARRLSRCRRAASTNCSKRRCKPRPHWSRFLSRTRPRPRARRHPRTAVRGGTRRSATAASPTTSTPTRRALDRPWDLDVLPLIIAPDEWREIEAGIAQRAELFNRVLADLYGSQSLLQAGADSAVADFRAQRLSAAGARHERARRRAPARLRRRPGALARRPLVGRWPTARRRPRAPAMRSRTG